MQSFIDSFPEQNFIRKFIEYYSQREESPVQYLLGAALHCLSSLAGRKIVLKLGSMKVYLSLYIVLVGRSGFMRKTSALRCAENNISSIDPNIIFPSDGTSSGAFLDLLIQKAHRAATCPELRQLLPSNVNGGDKRFIPLLTAISDCPSTMHVSYRNRNTKDEPMAKIHTILNPYFTLLGATTLEWFQVDVADITGGFFGRILPILAKDKDKRTIIIPPEDDKDKLSNLRHHLTCIKSFSTEIELSTEALKVYKAKYKEYEDLASTSVNDLVCTFYSRLQIYLLKFSALIELSTNPTSTTISEESIKYASVLLSFFKDWYEILITKHMSFNANDKLVKKIEDIVTRKPGLKNHHLIPLVQYLYKNVSEYHLAINSLIGKTVVVKDGCYWPLNRSEAFASTNPSENSLAP